MQKERPILFNGDMVRAILDGRKTQTRRKLACSSRYSDWQYACKTLDRDDLRGFLPGADENSFLLQKTEGPIVDREWQPVSCPIGNVGEVLYIRETWAVGKCADSLKPSELCPKTWLQENNGLWYFADRTSPINPISPRGKTRVSIHMPKWAARIKIEITDIRLERLQDISEADAKAEGIKSHQEDAAFFYDYMKSSDLRKEWFMDPVKSFESLWNSVNSVCSWDFNPWVWVIEFERVAP